MKKEDFEKYGFNPREIKRILKLSEAGQAAALELLKRGIEDHELITYEELKDLNRKNIESIGAADAFSVRVYVQAAIERNGGKCGPGDNQSKM